MFKSKKVLSIALALLVSSSILVSGMITFAATSKKTVKVASISLKKKTLSLKVKGTYNLSPSIKPSNATNKSISWSTKPTKIVSVDKKGIVTALKVGKTVVTVTTVDGKKKASCTITVSKAAPKATPTPTASATPTPSPFPTPSPTPSGPREWKLKYSEEFNTPIVEPVAWTKDDYSPTSDYHVPYVGENGELYVESKGAAFTENLNTFYSFRKSFAYGEDGWLTFEEYGRDADKNGTPESGGTVTNSNGVATLNSEMSTDGVIVRSTKALPPMYKIEVTLSNINFGGERNGIWTYDNKINGYEGTETGMPWYAAKTTGENGMHFLVISDIKPAPHPNILWYTHRKVFIETDNNDAYGTNPWSKVWDPVKKEAVLNGNHPLMMLWTNGDNLSTLKSNPPYVSYTPDGFKDDGTSVDCYLENEPYTFSVQRDVDSYTMSVSGKFLYGGQTTYTATRKFEDTCSIWHYNQTIHEYPAGIHNSQVKVNGQNVDTWPAGSAYPDYFYFGDPFVNYYVGSADFDNIKLYVYE